MESSAYLERAGFLIRRKARVVLEVFDKPLKAPGTLRAVEVGEVKSKIRGCQNIISVKLPIGFVRNARSERISWRTEDGLIKTRAAETPISIVSV